MNQYDQEMADLQSRLAFQEDVLSTLDARMAAQDREIQALQAQLRHLYKRLEELKDDVEGGTSPGAGMNEAPPPHY